jgi:hypothetical protein
MRTTTYAAQITAELQRLYLSSFETNTAQPPSLETLIEHAPGWWYTDALAYLARQEEA